VTHLTFAVCTYNRSERLSDLISAMRAQQCPVPYEILVVDNNSQDGTGEMLERLASAPGMTLRWVKEPRQGIAFARNRAIQESLDSDYLVFMDDDEMPQPGLLEAAVRVLEDEGADCVGGRVKVCFPEGERPDWLTQDLLGFLAEVDYGNEPFWVRDHRTPLWTANIAYRVSMFRERPSLRFDIRYNRAGNTVGGGEDAMLFRTLVDEGMRVRYCPEMIVEHYVESWRLHRRYFVKLHFVAGVRYGRYELVVKIMQVARLWVAREPGVLRQAMNASHAAGSIWGRMLSWRDRRRTQVNHG
jgi:glycosyltransferase involved in cell wall biosynthesis